MTRDFAPSIPIVISKVDAADVGNLPYCEVHRIRPLGEGGVDAPDNVACLCPARHREVHHGNAAEQIRAGLMAVRQGTPGGQSGRRLSRFLHEPITDDAATTLWPLRPGYRDNLLDGTA
jgi:hypothetical protein